MKAALRSAGVGLETRRTQSLRSTGLLNLTLTLSGCSRSHHMLCALLLSHDLLLLCSDPRFVLYSQCEWQTNQERRRGHNPNEFTCEKRAGESV